MTESYEKRKLSMLAWRQTHRAQFNEMQRRLQQQYYQQNKARKNSKDLGRYYYNQEARRLREIDTLLI